MKTYETLLKEIGELNSSIEHIIDDVQKMQKEHIKQLENICKKLKEGKV